MSNVLKYIDMRSNPEFNSLQAPFGHLGVSRSEMPQIDFEYRDDFISWLRKQGIRVRNIRVPIKSLKMSQSEYDRAKVLELMSSYRAGQVGKLAPIFISSDGYVVDGNHRMIAQYNLNTSRYMDATEIGSKMLDILELVHKYPHIRYRNLHDKSVK